MTTYPVDDLNFEDVVIDDLEVRKDGSVAAFGSDGLWLGWPRECALVPKVGDVVREYYCGNGKFTGVRGLFLNGARVYYETLQENRQRCGREAEERERKQREEFETTKRAALDAKYDALPLVFQKRIARFRRNNPDFRWQYEEYEMFCCEEAVKIVNALETPEAVDAFHALPYEEQQKRVPDLSDEHSGNTFGMACRLAYEYLLEPEATITEQGALTVLVGAAYGDTPQKGGTQ